MAWSNTINSSSFRQLFQARIKYFLEQQGYPFSIVTSTFLKKPLHLEDEINYFTSYELPVDNSPYPYELSELSTGNSDVKPLTKDAYYRLCCLYDAMNHLQDVYYNKMPLKEAIPLKKYKMNTLYLNYMIYLLFIIIVVYSLSHISLNSILLFFFSVLILLFYIFI